MDRDDWRGGNGRRDPRERQDFGQADYSTDFAYDPQGRTGFRVEPDPRPVSDEDRAYAQRMNAGAYPREAQSRSWMDRAGDFLAGPRPAAAPAPRRRDGPSDRVLWAVIVERLEDERRLDLRSIELIVEDGEVTLNGFVHSKHDKRRIEDVADIEGVRHVQNNLRIRERGHWAFL